VQPSAQNPPAAQTPAPGGTIPSPSDRHRGFIEEIPADLVAHVPRIEIVDPLLHLLRGNQARVSDHGGKDARLMDARTPQLQSQWVVPADVFGDASQHWD